MNINPRKFCVAPMMGFTTPYARKLYRILSKRAFLFTEMVPSKTMLYSKTRDLIIENYSENPVALQVGGAEPHELAECTKIAKIYNYDEINLNVGCPSKAVQKGSFGACLMNEKVLVRNCLEAMIESADIEVSIKCRIGIGKEFNYDFFCNFIDEIIRSIIFNILLEVAEITHRYADEPESKDQVISTIYLKFKKLVQEQILEHKTVQLYADQLHISNKYLIEIVKKTSGRTPHEVINEILLKEAYVLLGNPELTVSEIAFQLHFNSTSAFGRFFKKNTTISPSQYRTRQNIVR